MINHFRLITFFLLSFTSPFSEIIALDEESKVPDQLLEKGGQEKQKRDIRIQFEGVSYSDALQRFSQMANKPLIVESSLEGTLTFFDPEPYSYREALDVFNVILSMKGVALVENGRFLQLTKLENLKKLPLKVL